MAKQVSILIVVIIMACRSKVEFLSTMNTVVSLYAKKLDQLFLQISCFIWLRAARQTCLSCSVTPSRAVIGRQGSWWEMVFQLSNYMLDFLHRSVKATAKLVCACRRMCMCVCIIIIYLLPILTNLDTCTSCRIARIFWRGSWMTKQEFLCVQTSLHEA